LAPFIPHVCEDAWHRIGEESLISIARWPRPEKEDINMEVIELEETLKRTIKDVKHLSELTGCKEKLIIYTASKKEFDHFITAKEFMRKELGFSKVSIFMANDEERYDPKNRAQRARPKRPGIYLE
jgi:leucyl-tRNA synthetase